MTRPLYESQLDISAERQVVTQIAGMLRCAFVKNPRAYKAKQEAKKEKVRRMKWNDAPERK